MRSLKSRNSYSNFLDESPERYDPQENPQETDKNDNNTNNTQLQTSQAIQWTDHLEKQELIKSYKKFNKVPSFSKLQAFIAWVETKKVINKLTFYRSLKDFYFSTSQSAIHLYQKSEIFCLALSPDNLTLLVGCNNNSIYVWDLSPKEETRYRGKSNSKLLSQIANTNTENQPILIDELIGHENKVSCIVAYGKFLYSGSFDTTIKIWDYHKCLNTLNVHDQPVSTIALTSDGTILASAGEDNLIILYDLTTQTTLKTLIGHTSPVDTIIFSPTDPNRIISGSWDLTIRIWDIKSESARKLEGHKDLVRSLAISPNGNILYSGSADKSIFIWDLKKFEKIGVLEGHTEGVRTLFISKDGRNLASSSSDKTVRIWDLRADSAGKMAPKPKILDGHTERIKAVVISGIENKKVISGCWDKIVRIWTLKDKHDKDFLKGHKNLINAIIVSEDEELVISASDDKLIIIWSLRNREKLTELKGHEGAVKTIDLTTNSAYLISAGSDKKIIKWSLDKNEKIGSIKAHDDEITAVKFIHDDNKIVSVSLDKTIRIWNFQTEELLKIKKNHPGDIISLDTNPFMKTILTGARDGGIYIWDDQYLNMVSSLSGHTGPITQMKLLDYNHKLLVSSSMDGTLRVWDVEKMITLVKLIGHESGVLCFKIEKEGTKIVSGGQDKTLRIWDISTGKQIGISGNNKDLIKAMDFSKIGGFLVYTVDQNLIKIRTLNKIKTINILKAHKKPVKCLDISKDETILVSGSSDNTIKIWDFKTCMEKSPPLVGHSHQVLTVKITQDILKVISGSADNTIRIWNLNNSTQIGVLKGTSHRITCMEIFNEGKSLLSGAYDNSLRIWDLTKLEKIEVKYFHSSPINALTISSDQSRFYSGGKDNQILVGDLNKFHSITFLKGHTKEVNALILTNEGKLVSGSSDKTIKIWNITQNRLISTINIGSEVYALGLNQMKTKILLGCEEKGIQMWDLQNHKQIAYLEGHMLSVNALLVLSNNRWLVSGSTDTNIRVWDLNDSKKLPFCEGHSLGINQVIVSHDGMKVLSVSKDKRAIVWDLTEGRQLRVFQQHGWIITSLAITSDGTKAITATYSLEIMVWDIETNEVIKHIKTESPIECLIISKDDQMIIVGYCDSFIRIININNGEILQTLEKHTGIVKCLCLNKSGSRLLSGGDDNLIVLWDLHTFQATNVLVHHENSVTKVIISQDESRMFSGSDDRVVMIWNFHNFTVINELNLPQPIRTMALTSDERRLIVGCCPDEHGIEGKFIYIYDLKTYKEIIVLDCVFGCKALCLTPNCDKLIAASDKSLYIFNVKYDDYSLDKVLRGYSNKITFEELIDNRLILATDDNVISIWDLAKTKKIAVLEGHTDNINACLLLKDGRLISASNDKSIRIWELPNEEKNLKSITQLALLQGHSSAVNTLAVTKDENVLVSGGTDKSIRLWDLVTFKQKIVFHGHSDSVTSIRILKNGQMISGGKDRVLKLWHIDFYMSRIVEETQPLAVINHNIENIVLSPDEKLFLILTGGSKFQVWTTLNFEWLNECDLKQNNFHSLPTFLSTKDCRLVIYFNKIYDCFNGEVIFSFQLYHDLLSFYYDRNSYNFYYISSQFELYEMSKLWLNNYLYMFLNDDSLPMLPKDENAICNRTQSIFPFFLSFMHLIAIFEKKDYFNIDKMEELYGIGNVSLDYFYHLDIFLNTPLEILIVKKNTNLIFKYFELLFQVFDYPNTTFYQKTRFFNYKFKTGENILDLMNTIIDVCEDDYSILNKLLEKSFLDIDPKIYANNLIFDELNIPVVIESDSLYTIDKNFIEKHLREKFLNRNIEKTSIVKCKVICLPGLNDISNPKTCKIFNHLADGNNINDIFNNEVLFLLSHFIWTTQVKFYYKIEAFIFITFFLIFNLNFLYIFKEREIVVSFQYCDTLSLVLDSLVILYSFYCATNELWQMFSTGFFDYFDSIWNYIDIILIPLMLASSLFDIYLIQFKILENISYIKLIFSTCMFFFWFRLLSFFRALKEYASTMRLILNVITGVPYFVIFLVLFLLMLASSYLILVNQRNGETPTLWQAFFDVYLSAVGDYSGLEYYTTEFSRVIQVFIIAATFLFSIILFNLLVAILGDLHDEVKNAEDQTRLYELTNIIEDTNTAVITRIMKKMFTPKKRGNFLVYLYNEKHEKVKVNQYDELEKKMEDLNKITNKNIEKIEEMTHENFEKLKDFIIEMKEKLEKTKIDIVENKKN